MIDSALIEVKAGNGGSGKVLFRRETHVPRGGPAGGDGGKGGDVHLIADPTVATLKGFQFKRSFKAGDGEDGGGRNMSGRNGEDLEVRVPVGTEVIEVREGNETSKLGELIASDQRMLVAKGGSGGWGNARAASSTNQTPLLAESGHEGERRTLKFTLKLLADVGIIGMPNAGKSSLLSVISAARPKIAGYPFTTLEPVLGVVERGFDRFIAVDIPGLIEGAHAGAGLGDEFLKHIERTRVLVHLVDGSAEKPAANLALVDKEIEQFGRGLPDKLQIIAINKVDMPEVAENKAKISAALKRKAGTARKVFFISAATREGTRELLDEVWRVVREARAAGALPPQPDVEPPVIRPRPVDSRPNAVAEGPGVFRIVHPIAVRLAKGSSLGDWSVRVQYHARLGHMKVLDDLEKLGVKRGDKILVADREFVWD
jgi:GTPase